jgi:hypothetical protein
MQQIVLQEMLHLRIVGRLSNVVQLPEVRYYRRKVSLHTRRLVVKVLKLLIAGCLPCRSAHVLIKDSLAQTAVHQTACIMATCT